MAAREVSKDVLPNIISIAKDKEEEGQIVEQVCGSSEEDITVLRSLKRNDVKTHTSQYE